MNIQIDNKKVASIKIAKYEQEKGYGFVEETSGLFPITYCSEAVYAEDDAFLCRVTEQDVWWENMNHYGFGGMAYRIDLPRAGAYHVEVELAGDIEHVTVAINGMSGEKIAAQHTWDAAQLIPKDNRAIYEGRYWKYDVFAYAPFIEIELYANLDTTKKPEPFDWTIGMKAIHITPIETKPMDKPTLYLLGDSTVKSYIFEEAGMSAWGQVIGKLFDQDKIKVINYSMGGRSFKNIYEEGRFNQVLLHARPGDYICLQSGHNDESVGPLSGPEARFGRGSTAESYQRWMEDVYIPSLTIQNINIMMVTPMTRINYNETTEHNVVLNGFKHSDSPGIDFPGIMKAVATDKGLPIIDLYERSIDYVTSIGGIACKAVFLGVEPGELASKTNSGSYANGNPSGSGDGTHYKEALSKQFARMITEEMVKERLEISTFLRADVRVAIEASDWSEIYPEWVNDIQVGEKSYYRNQIEKMVQLGVMTPVSKDTFDPKGGVSEDEFARGLAKVWNIEPLHLDLTGDRVSREKVAYIIMQYYKEAFGMAEDRTWNKPVYMTDYNHIDMPVTSQAYDPNLDGQSAGYYPLVEWEELKDRDEIDPSYYEYFRQAYGLGLMRPEVGVVRGQMISGDKVMPKQMVTREKMAKYLYFLWILKQPILLENHVNTVYEEKKEL